MTDTIDVKIEKPKPPWHKKSQPSNWEEVISYIEELIDYKIKKEKK